MKSFALILLSFFALGLWSAEVDLSKVKMGEKAEKVVTDMNAAIQKLNQDYLDATEKIKTAAVNSLERERSRTKDGLVGMAIQHQINFIVEMKPPVDFLGRVIPKAFDQLNPELVSGKWKVANNKGWLSEWTFMPNGTVADITKRHIATWSLNPTKDGYTIKEGNRVHTMGLPDSANHWTGIDAEGRTLLFDKIIK